jgi:hypothetical protein
MSREAPPHTDRAGFSVNGHSAKRTHVAQGRVQENVVGARVATMGRQGLYVPEAKSDSARSRWPRLAP